MFKARHENKPNIPQSAKERSRVHRIAAAALLVGSLGVGALVHSNARTESTSVAAGKPTPAGLDKEARPTPSTVAEATPTSQTDTTITPKPSTSAPKPTIKTAVSTKRTTTSVVEQARSPENGAELQIASTVLLKQGNNPNCPAIHIGNGNFLTGEHCVRDKPQTDWSAWQGKGPSTMQRVGSVQSIKTNGSTEDRALLSIPEASDLPSVKLADHAPDPNGKYFITGYSQKKNGEQVQFAVNYLATLKGRDFDPNGFYAMSPDADYFFVGIPKGVPEADGSYMYGLSGGGLVDEQGNLYGQQSVHGEPTDNGGKAYTYNGVAQKNPATYDNQIVIGFAVVNSAKVAQMQAA